jgi:hypothetical protein
MGYHEHDPAMGRKNIHPMGYFSQCFLLYRGAFMKPEWLKKWATLIGKKDKYADDQPYSIYLPENTSFTKNFEHSLTFSYSPMMMPDRVPVMFVISVRNWHGFHGFRVNKSQFSAHYQEQEVLLFEGFKVYVLHIEEVYAKVLDKTVTVVHLYNH